MANELFEADRLFADFFKSSSVGLAVFDRQLRYRTLNPYLAAVHGASAQAHVGKHIREILGSFAQQVEPALKRVLATRQPVFNIEISGALPGRLHGGHWVDNFFPIAGSDGVVKQVGAVVVELPEHARLQVLQGAASLAGEVLRSWKDIARYVGTCVKTVQRWEHSYGFPVRRLSHNKGAVVFALTAEMDDWIHRRSHLTNGQKYVPLVESRPSPSWVRTTVEGGSRNLPLPSQHKRSKL